MNKKDLIAQTLNEIMDYIGLDNDFDINELKDEGYKVVIKGENLNFLIGYRGQSLDALQTILSQILHNKTGEWGPVVVDVNDYKDKRTDKLHEIAKKYIDKVRFFQNEYELPPMKAWERKQIHELVSDYDDILSESKGEGKDRRIVLKPKKTK